MLNAAPDVNAWEWIGGAVAVALTIYVAFIVALLLLGRKADARAWATLVPDCVILFARLVRDERVSRRSKLLLAALLAYLATPVDLIPDFIPLVGGLDDAILVAIVLRIVLRRAGVGLVREHWPGPQASLSMVLRLAGTC